MYKDLVAFKYELLSFKWFVFGGVLYIEYRGYTISNLFYFYNVTAPETSIIFLLDGSRSGIWSNAVKINTWTPETLPPTSQVAS